MTYTYKYIGPVPTVFITIKKDGETWVPNPGDEVTLDYPVFHPWLELVTEVGDEGPAEDTPPADSKIAKKAPPTPAINTAKLATESEPANGKGS